MECPRMCSRDIVFSLSKDPSRYKNSVNLFRSGWWVFLMVNISPRAVKTTQIKIDQNPELSMLMINSTKNKEQNAWVIVMRVGRFDTKPDAIKFYDKWTKKSRGLCSRVFKGLSLIEKYATESNINAWTTSRKRRDMLSFYGRCKLWLENPKSEPKSNKKKKGATKAPRTINKLGIYTKPTQRCFCFDQKLLQVV